MAHENLYDSLGYNISQEDLTSVEKQELVDILGSLDQERKEMAYMMTLYDYVKHNPSTKVIYPYKSKQVTTDRLELKVDAMPIRLKRILYKFAKLAEMALAEPATPTPI